MRCRCDEILVVSWGSWRVGEKKFADAWNFGPSENEFCSVEEVLNIANKYWRKIKYEIQTNSALHEAKLLKLDSSKANKSLKWKSTWNIEEAIEKTIIWYRNLDEDNVVLTKNQINEYVSQAKKENYSWAWNLYLQK